MTTGRSRGRPPANEKSKPVLLRLPPAMAAELAAEADRRAIPVATLARLALREWLDEATAKRAKKD